jgi:tetratricopeptide (TPR) repeat protein
MKGWSAAWRRGSLAALLATALAGPAAAAPPHCQLASHDEVGLQAPAERIAWLTEELAQCPDPQIQALAYYSRGKAYIDLENDESAVADLTQSIALAPADVYYDYAARAFAYLRLNRQQEAIDDATASLDAEPFFAQAYNTRGVAECNLHRVQDGTMDILTAIDLDRAYGRAWQDFLRKGRYYEGAIGGTFDAASKTALAEWCKSHRIAPGPTLD